MKTFIALASIVIAGMAPPIALATAMRICGTQVYDGCEPGEYSCTPDSSYPCSTIGNSLKKNGKKYPFRLCITDIVECADGDRLCQRDTYWKNTACDIYCNEYSRYISGCGGG